MIIAGRRENDVMSSARERRLMNRRIQEIFSEVPGRYEAINHILTFGLDVRWRRKAAVLAAEAEEGLWLDLCSGTGEMAALLGSKARGGTRIYATDFSLPMLSRAAGKPRERRIRLLVYDATSLPFSEGTFDLLTLSFATRNLNTNMSSLMRAFREFHRVLRSGGMLVGLETSRPSSRIVRSLLHLYKDHYAGAPPQSPVNSPAALYLPLLLSAPRTGNVPHVSGFMGFPAMHKKPVLQSSRILRPPGR